MPVPIVVNTDQPSMNQPPPPPAAKPAAEAKPAATAPAAAPPAAEPAAAEKAAASKLQRSQELIAKVEKDARERRELEQRSAQAQRTAAQERQRANELAARETTRQREDAQRVAREKARQNHEQLAKSPDEWLKQQADAMLNIQDQLQTERTKREALEQHIYSEAKARKIEAANKHFLEAASNAKNYPSLAEMHPDVILAAAHQLATSKGWGDDEILDYLEQRQLARQPNGASKTPEKKKTAEVHQAATAPKQVDTPRAISSSMSKGFTMPDNYDKLPERERRKLLVQKYKADVAAAKAAKDG